MEYRVKGNAKTALALLVLVAAICFWSGRAFVSMWADDLVIPAPGFEKHMLSQWEPGLAGTNGDTAVYIQDGEEPGGTVLILGGTHPNEPAGQLSAVMYLERAKVKTGRLIVLPFANRSAVTHNSPQDAAPQRFTLDQGDGHSRTFKFGSRATNPIDQWPDPDIYIHQPSGQHLDGTSRSNLNRGYPGSLTDGLTQRVAYAIMELLKKEKVDLAFDLHEASPEYPVVNAMVVHEQAMELAAAATMELEMAEIPMRLEPSPVNLRGLSHREWGDAIPELHPVLMEAGNPSQGRLRGRTDEALIITGADKAYAKASKLGRLFIPYETDQPLALRVARHVTAVKACLDLMADDYGDDKAFEVDNIPEFEEIRDRGVGAWLNRVPDGSPSKQ